MNSTPRLPVRALGRVAQHKPLLPRRAQGRVIRPACWGFSNSNRATEDKASPGGKVFNSVPPGLPVQGMVRRR
eukprot:352239-Chlamydomonas_euryale.AAC.2